MKILTHIFFSVIVLAMAGYVSGATSLDMVDMLPVYHGAYDINKRKLGHGSNQQLSFRTKAAYPSIKVLDFYDKYFIDSGWKKCRGNIEEWQSFVDAANGPDQLVHQIAHYFVKEDERKLSMVFILYRSDWSKGKTEPDSDMQNVFILMQKDIDLQEAFQRLSISC